MKKSKNKNLNKLRKLNKNSRKLNHVLDNQKI